MIVEYDQKFIKGLMNIDKTIPKMEKIAINEMHIFWEKTDHERTMKLSPHASNNDLEISP